jgi:Lrp/AsnC family leucine-responsive transcriptional regulator
VEPPALDAIDRDILRELGRDGRATWQQLGPRVGLSPNAVAERVRRLERRGVIAGYGARVDPVALGRNLEALVLVRVIPGMPREPFEAFVVDHPAVDDCVHLTGPHDYVLRVHCHDTAQLDELLMAVKREVHVAETETRVVLRRIP